MKKRNLKLNLLWFFMVLFGLLWLSQFFLTPVYDTQLYSLSDRLNLLYISSHHTGNYLEGIPNIFLGLFMAFSLLIITFDDKKA